MEQIMSVVRDLGPVGCIGAVVFILVAVAVIKNICSKRSDGNNNGNGNSSSSNNNNSTGGGSST